MTTTVTINAHCDSETTEVLVSVLDATTFQKIRESVIQNRGVHTEYAYGNQFVTVHEVAKKSQMCGVC